MTKILFPGWRYGPGGQCELFQRAEDVPEGWARNPADVKEPGAPEPKAEPEAVVEAVADMAAAISKFDHDGDGRPGGSLLKAKRAKPRRKVKRRDPRK